MLLSWHQLPIQQPAESVPMSHLTLDFLGYLAILQFSNFAIQQFCTHQSSVSQLQFIEHTPWQPSHSFTFEVIVILKI